MAHLKFVKSGEESSKKTKPVSLKLRLYLKILSVISILELGIIIYGVMKYVNI